MKTNQLNTVERPEKKKSENVEWTMTTKQFEKSHSYKDQKKKKQPTIKTNASEIENWMNVA